MPYAAVLLCAMTVVAAVAAAEPGEATAPRAGESAPWDHDRLQTDEPMYIVAGPVGGWNAKFQFSLRYRVFDPLYVGFTQTSLWDWEGESRPFYDTSYKPRAWLGRDRLWGTEGVWNLGGAVGAGHESNGKAGDDSRSVNIAFLRPRLRLDGRDGWRAEVEPMTYLYLEKSDNPDIQRYRGYCDLTLAAVQEHGLKIAATLRKGADHRLEVGSAQLDISYPLGQWLGGGDGPYLHLQGFTGYGESLLDYDKRHDSQIRLGFSIVR